MATLDIRGAIVEETATAIKAPCLVATTGGNIALSGVQTVDGVIVGNNNERVLVKDQAIPSQNGIYQAMTGTWLLAPDFNSNTAVALGTLVLVTGGAVNQGILFEQICTDNPITIGTSAIAFSPLAQNAAQAATSTTSNSIGAGSKTFTIQSGKAFVANQYVVIYQTSNSVNAMLAQITSYSGSTLAVSAVATGGSGAGITNWSIVLVNSQAAAGIQPPVGTGNVTGPGSSTSGHVATFADTSGKVLQDGGMLVPAANTINASMLLQSAAAFGVNMLNGTIVPTVASNALTLAIKTLAGADPSASDPVWFCFRSATPGSGALAVIEVTAALSITVPAGATMGFQNATPGRLWLLAYNNSGTVQLAVINCLSASGSLPAGIYPLAGWGIVNVSGGNGGNLAQVIYGTGGANVPYSVLGFCAWETGSTLATAGTWGVAPTRTELYRPTVALPGMIVQSVFMHTASNTTTSSGSVQPTNVTGNITPASSANLVRASWSGTVTAATSGSNVYAYLQLTRGAVNLGGPTFGGINGAGSVQNTPAAGVYLDFPQSLTAVTYTIELSNPGGGTTVGFPTGNGGQILLEELMA